MVDYLESYMKSIEDASKYSTEKIIKGKMLVAGWTLPEVSVVAAPKLWLPPPTDYVALSVDGSFSGESGAAAAGMILRHHNGSVIFAAYRFISIATMHRKRSYMQSCKEWHLLYNIVTFRSLSNLIQVELCLVLQEMD